MTTGHTDQSARLESGAPRVSLLLDETQRLMAERDLGAFLRHVCTAAKRLTEASIAGVGIVGDDGRVEDFVSVGLDESIAAAVRQKDVRTLSAPARDVLEKQAVVRALNPGGDPTAIGLSPDQPPVHSFLFVPVASPSRMYGWLGLLDKGDATGFSHEDEQLAATFGGLAGMAYENARLVSRLEAQARELREYEERTDFAMSAARTGVSYRDLDSSWVELSRSLAALFGLPADVRRITQEDFYRRCHPDDAGMVREAVERAIADRSEFALEFRLQQADEGVRWFQFRGRVAPNDAERASRVVGVITDITERRSLGLQLRQAQKMEALGQLAGGIAHDFNNLLTAIIGYGRFALESADLDQRHDLEEIVKAAGRAAGLTKQLLAFSRRHAVETVVLDINGVIVEMVSMLRRVIGADVELTTSLAAGVAHVRADRSQIEQVVMNLVINARDATGSGGRIHVAIGTLELDQGAAARVPGLTEGSWVTLSVSDDGAGMSDATMARVFEPFFTTKPRGRGTGLGLATVYGIVVQSGGTIQVESELERGSTFTVYLPQVHEPVQAAARSAESPAPRGAHTVLLVEDEQAVRELVRIILERAGHRVVEAASPDEAVVLFSGMDAVDLLLTDVVMPRMSGFDLFHALVERRPSLRVLFISGYTDYAMFDRALVERGGAAFLEKPFSAEVLVAKVRDVLSH